MRMSTITIVCLLIRICGGSAEHTPLWATTFYVDSDHVNASDVHPGTDQDFPWSTLQKAFSTAVADDRALFNPCTLSLASNAIQTNDGSAENPIIFEVNNSAARTLILDLDPLAKDDARMVFIDNAGSTSHVPIRGNYLTLKGFYFRKVQLRVEGNNCKVLDTLFYNQGDSQFLPSGARTGLYAVNAHDLSVDTVRLPQTQLKVKGGSD